MPLLSSWESKEVKFIGRTWDNPSPLSMSATNTTKYLSLTKIGKKHKKSENMCAGTRKRNDFRANNLLFSWVLCINYLSVAQHHVTQKETDKKYFHSKKRREEMGVWKIAVFWCWQSHNCRICAHPLVAQILGGIRFFKLQGHELFLILALGISKKTLFLHYRRLR